MKKTPMLVLPDDATNDLQILYPPRFMSRRDATHGDSDSESDDNIDTRGRVAQYRKNLRSIRHRIGRDHTFKEFGILDPREHETLEDESYMLCARRVYGFILRERK